MAHRQCHQRLRRYLRIPTADPATSTRPRITTSHTPIPPLEPVTAAVTWVPLPVGLREAVLVLRPVAGLWWTRGLWCPLTLLWLALWCRCAVVGGALPPDAGVVSTGVVCVSLVVVDVVDRVGGVVCFRFDRWGIVDPPGFS